MKCVALCFTNLIFLWSQGWSDLWGSTVYENNLLCKLTNFLLEEISIALCVCAFISDSVCLRVSVCVCVCVCVQLCAYYVESVHVMWHDFIVHLYACMRRVHTKIRIFNMHWIRCSCLNSNH